MRFLSFGSGSSGNCYYLSTANDALLIDCGLGVRKLKKYVGDYGLSLTSVHNIILTHDHADHVKSVGSISASYDVPVYATKLVHEGIVANPSVRKRIAQERKRFIEKNKTYQIGDFEVTPFDVPHDSKDNVGYVIKADGVTFSIITDCGHITDEMGPIIANTDYLVIESNHDVEMLRHGPYPLYLQNRILGPNGHMSNETCGNAIAKFASPRLRHVWLCHLSAQNNNPDVAYNTIDEILRANGIEIGKDFQVTVLRRTIPTGFFDL